jgi:hypothetical protein
MEWFRFLWVKHFLSVRFTAIGGYVWWWRNTSVACQVLARGFQKWLKRRVWLWLHRSNQRIKDRHGSSTSGGIILENDRITVPDPSAVFELSVGIVYERLRTRSFDFDSDVIKKKTHVKMGLMRKCAWELCSANSDTLLQCVSYIKHHKYFSYNIYDLWNHSCRAPFVNELDETGVLIPLLYTDCSWFELPIKCSRICFSPSGPKITEPVTVPATKIVSLSTHWCWKPRFRNSNAVCVRTTLKQTVIPFCRRHTLKIHNHTRFCHEYSEQVIIPICVRCSCKQVVIPVLFRIAVIRSSYRLCPAHLATDHPRFLSAVLWSDHRTGLCSTHPTTDHHTGFCR